MPDLRDLHQALAALKASGGFGRVYVYGTGEHGGAMQHGFFGVSAGRSCVIDFAKKPQEQALADILALRIVKIISMPLETRDAEIATDFALDIDDVLQRLSPAADDSSEFGLVGLPEHIEASTTETQKPKQQERAISLEMMVLERSALEILETYYGTATSRKVGEVAAKFPPHEKPVQFLNGCKQLAAAMVGGDKANQLFGPLYDTIQL